MTTGPSFQSEPNRLEGCLVAYPGRAVYEFAQWGHVAEGLRNGLQNRVHQFNSGRGLHINPLRNNSFFKWRGSSRQCDRSRQVGLELTPGLAVNTSPGALASLAPRS